MSSPTSVFFYGNYIASSDDIDNVLIPMRIGQLATHIKGQNTQNTQKWYARTSREIFDKNWQTSATKEKDSKLIGKAAYGVLISHIANLSEITCNREIVKTTGMILGHVIQVIGEEVLLECTEAWINSEKFKTDQRDLSAIKLNPQACPKSDDHEVVYTIRSTECFDYIRDGATIYEAEKKYPLGISIGKYAHYFLDLPKNHELREYVRTVAHPDLPEKKPTQVEGYNGKRVEAFLKAKFSTSNPVMWLKLTNQICSICKAQDVCLFLNNNSQFFCSRECHKQEYTTK